MTSPQQDTIQHAIELGRRAVLFDQEGKHDGAAYFYLEASRVRTAWTSKNILENALKESYNFKSWIMKSNHVFIMKIIIKLEQRSSWTD